MMGGTPFDQSRDSCRQGIWICPNEEMHMVALNCQLNNLPIMLIYHFTDDLLKPIGYWTISYLSSPPWTPNDMVHNQMDCMIIINVLHVYNIPDIDTSVNEIVPLGPCAQAPPYKGGPIHPLVKTEGLSGPSTVNWH